MIKIKEPRYRDRKVLVARYHIGCGEDLTIEIQKGSYKGIYRVSNDDICASDIESMKTRRGNLMSMRAIPLDKLERIGE